MYHNFEFVLIVLAAALIALPMDSALIGQNGHGWSDTIKLGNPSFEDVPRAGGVSYSGSIRGWYDCALTAFPGETPPDIHPHQDAWKVSVEPSDGKTYLGMVVRENETNEFLSQALSQPLAAGNCYAFSVDLARSATYFGARAPTVKQDSATFSRPFTTPAVLRVWGGNRLCGQKELLAESDPVREFSWRRHTFKLRPKQEFRYIVFEAFFKTPVLTPYDGHVLVDNASNIIRIECHEDPAIVLEQIEKEKHYNRRPVNPVRRSKPKPSVSDPPRSVEPPLVRTKPPPRPVEPENKILSDLDRSKVSKGQTIRIKNLYFNADSSRITGKSFEVLEEISSFLVENPDVTVEIGGHTNTIPSPSYCDTLSTARAKAVTDYLIARGIPGKQVEYKGYGKNKPLIPNDLYSRAAQQRNQRVEIKILSVGE